MGDMFAVGACDCNCISTNYSVTCNGCHAALDNYAVSIYNTSGGTLLYSLTTSNTGVISLPSGTYWIQSPDGFFYGPSFTVSGTIPVTLTAASGYVCLPTCNLPLSTSTTLTFSANTTYGAMSAPATYTASIPAIFGGGSGWYTGSFAGPVSYFNTSTIWAATWNISTNILEVSQCSPGGCTSLVFSCGGAASITCSPLHISAPKTSTACVDDGFTYVYLDI